MHPGIRNTLFQWFKRFADSYLSDDELVRANVILKYDHTMRVCDLALEIADSLSLDTDTRMLAWSCALFHDIGRFPQFARYRTFYDAGSVDHGELGASFFTDNPLPGIIPDDWNTVIHDTVHYHNSHVPPSDLPDITRFILGILRDADKLDIMAIMVRQFDRGRKADPSVVLHLPDTPGYTPEIYRSVISGRTVSNSLRRNQNDMKLGYLAWVYDLNHAYSLCHVRDNKLLDALAGILPDTDEIRQAKFFAESYISKRLSERQEAEWEK